MGSADELTPSGGKARARANIEAIGLVRRLETEARQVTGEEQRRLAAWSSWGAIPQIFDETKTDWAAERAELRSLLREEEWEAAELTTLNAHFTSPAIVQAMWDGLGELGFEQGRVLEPGCGSGNFIGLAPESARMTGVELDPVTSAIASHLYPDAEIRTESFADTRVVPARWDAAVGNVPFSEIKLADEAWNPGRRFAMHNHFIGKSMAGVRPGGVGIMLTSAWTMDARNPAFRAEVSKECDFLGAVRLPNGAHQRTAGTDAVTDIVVLRKRLEGEQPSALTRAWITASPVEVTNTATGAVSEVMVNDYFTAHPEQVLGDFDLGGRFGGLTVTAAQPPETTSEGIRTGIGRIAERARTDGRTFTPADPEWAAAREERRGRQAAVDVWDGTVLDVDGALVTVHAGEYEPVTVAKKHEAEVRSLIGLRDHAVGLVRLQLETPAESDELINARDEAQAAWQAHVDRFGPINRYTTSWVSRTRRDEETGERVKVREEARRRPAAAVAMRSDPMWALTTALERFNEQSQTAQAAAILTQRTVFQERPLLGADTAEEALMLSIEQVGRADLTRIAALLGTDAQTARAELGELVFDDPQARAIVPATDYLSGNVRSRLAAARQAHTEDAAGGCERNIAALEAVIPADVPVEDIEAVVGAVWISAEDHEAFLREITGDAKASVRSPGPAVWHVKPGSGGRQTLASTSEWGTERKPAHDLFRSLVTGGQIQVFDEHVDGLGTKTRTLNPVETEAAREKAEAIAERFSEWVWEDPERATRLHAEYQERFNSLVMRDYTADGQRLTLPGLAADFVPHAHQRTAVARIVGEPTVGLFHEVGAGKTAAMVMGMMELKRRGMINKPVVVVPGHMLEQFTREWQQLYLNARLLAAGSDDVKAGTGSNARARFVAQVATNDWDGIIMTGAAFEKIGVAARTRQDYIDGQVAETRAAIDTMRADPDMAGTRTFKQLQTAVKREEEKLKELLPDRDAGGLNFEDLGIDYIALDEAHLVKNLHTLSGIPGGNITGSKRAQDMHMKVDYLRQTYGDRVATFATGTPIPNSITEAHVMMRYLRPDLLEQSGTLSFDAWANTFGEQVARIERDAGGRMRQKTRLAKFKNVPEMLSAWHQFADTALTADLDLKLPQLVEGADGQRRPEMVVIPRSSELADYMEELTERLDKLSGRAGKGEDNHLSVYTDGRRAALDLRLVGREQGGTSKVDVVGQRVAGIWRDVRDRQYPVPGTDEVSENRGGLQIVFCGLSTPNPERWDFYTQLRGDLVDTHGMDRSRIAFIHEARNDEQKAALFRKARDGELDVLVGSSELMGTGANIQLRAAALHHVDCPWRPAELTQREGRILRQGNANEEVQVLRYAVEDSFDSTQWDTIFRKAAATAQIMRSTFDARDLDDPGDLAIDAQQLMAAASGNPLVMQRVELDTTVQKLSRRERGHERGQAALRHRESMATRRIDNIDRAVPVVHSAAQAAVNTGGDAFTAEVAGRSYTKRAEANLALLTHLRTRMEQAPYTTTKFDELCRIGGQTVSAEIERDMWTVKPQLRFRITDTDVDSLSFTVDRAQTQRGPLSEAPNLITLLENRVRALPDTLTKLQTNRDAAVRERDEARVGLARPFKHAVELAAARAELAEVDRTLADEAQTTTGHPDAEAAATGPDQAGVRTAVAARVRESFDRMRTERSRDAAADFIQACGEAGVPTSEAQEALSKRRLPEMPEHNTGHERDSRPAGWPGQYAAAVMQETTSGPELA